MTEIVRLQLGKENWNCGDASDHEVEKKTHVKGGKILIPHRPRHSLQYAHMCTLGSKLQWTLVSCLPSAGFKGSSCHIWHFMWLLGIELRASRLCGKHFTSGTVSLAHHSALETGFSVLWVDWSSLQHGD